MSFDRDLCALRLIGEGLCAGAMSFDATCAR